MFKLPSQTIFYQIEKSIKEYRRFAQQSINQKIKGLTLDQALLLISINDNPKMSLTEQSQLLFKESSSITRMIESLVQKEYISRNINGDDKRKFDLIVTTKGEETLKLLTTIIESNRAKALQAISKSDLDQLGGTLSKIITNCKMVVFIIAFFAGINTLYAQDLSSKKEKSALIKQVNKILIDNYVFPEVAVEIEQYVSKKQQQGAYDKVNDPVMFAELLTKDIQSVCHDKHLRVLYEPEQIKKQKETVDPADSLKHIAERERWLKSINYGFQEVKILDGNVGYLDLRGFANPDDAEVTADASLSFLRNTDAIIIDIRKNGGGSPEMVQWLASYFFGGERFLLNTFYKRQDDFIKQFWTIPHAKSSRLPNVNLYILTSNQTISAAEEFAYDLKHLNRATIIGEVTGGGAHAGGRINASPNYNVWTPTSRAINPITKTNWEGKGVEPHIEVSAQKAFDTAYIKSLEDLSVERKDINYNAIIEKVKGAKN